MNNYPFQAVIITLNNHKGDFIAAQKDFDKRFQPIDKVHLVRGFLEYLEQKIYQYGKDIPEHQHYLNEYVEKYAPTKYYEKIKPLEEATVREKIARKKKEAGFCKRIFDRCEQDGSNICYCVWLYNEGNFRTHKERGWADGYIKYLKSDLANRFNKMKKIRNFIGLSIFLPFISTGVLIITLGSLLVPIWDFFKKTGLTKYYIINSICGVFENTAYFLYTVCLGSLSLVGLSAGTIFILYALIAVIIMSIITFVYKLSLPPEAIKQVNKYSNDTIIKLMVNFTLGAIAASTLSHLFSKHKK